MFAAGFELMQLLPLQQRRTRVHQDVLPGTILVITRRHFRRCHLDISVMAATADVLPAAVTAAAAAACGLHGVTDAA